MLTKRLKNKSDCFNANVTLQYFLIIDINVTCEPVQDPQAYISWIISYCQYINLINFLYIYNKRFYLN